MFLLWLSFACLAAAVVMALLRPLARDLGAGEPVSQVATDADVAVYKDQLTEIEAEQRRGIIGAAEAEAARIEISRRLIAAADRSSATGSPTGAAATGSGALAGIPGVALATAILVPVTAIALYLAVGSPSLPDQPRSARVAPEPRNAKADELIRLVELRLKEKPDDGDGWDVIAPVYVRIERFKDAIHAYEQAIRLKGESLKRLAGLAEAHVLAENGIIGDPARLAYQKMARLEPGHPVPRFWLALAKEQDGELAAALADYDQLLREAPAEAPYRPTLVERIGIVKRRLSGAEAAAKGLVPTPDKGAASAIERLPADDQLQAINAMVDGLAARLAKNGRDIEGWQRLIRAYVVLGKRDDARQALSKARDALADDKGALDVLSTLADSLGLGS